MCDPKWMGTSPSDYRCSEDSKTVLFNWNPEKKDRPTAYKTDVVKAKPEVNNSEDIDEDSGNIRYIYNKDRSHTVQAESSPRFLSNNRIVFQVGYNFFQLNLSSNELKLLTNFVKKSDVSTPLDRKIRIQKMKLSILELG